MERPPLAHILCALLFLAPILAIASPASAELSGNVAFSTEGLSMSPSAAVEGGDVTFTLSLQNTANIIAEDVVVEFHKNSFEMGNPASLQITDVDASSFEDVNFVWTNLAWGEGEQTLVIRVNHLDDPKIISHDFNVSGLANLRLSHFELSPASGAHAGDPVGIQIQVENAGHADAPASHLELTVAGSANLLPVSSLQAGDTIWMNQTATAPAAGTYNVFGVVNADSSDNIVESTTADNTESRTLVIDTLPDYRHADGPTVVAESGLAGPWTLSGTIARDGGIGTTTAPLEIRIQGGITLEIVNLPFTDADSFAEYSVIITSQELTDTTPGDVYLDLEIDPSINVPQSNPFNNLESVSLTIYQEPNVVVTGVANVPSTVPGNMVTFTVTLQNVGMVTTQGVLSATFDSQSLTPQNITLLSSSTGNEGQYSATFTAFADGLTRDIPFEASWTKTPGFYDRLETDNVATSSVRLNSNLKLQFLLNTEGWTPDAPPLYASYSYVYTIDVRAQSGAGNETFECIDRTTNTILDTTSSLEFSTDEQQTIRCVITPQKPGQIELAITPQGSSIQEPHAKVWSVELESGTDVSGGGDSASILLFAVAGLIALGALIGAVVLTRRGLADADRETYDSCPACEGDIEGDEDICPHCDFDLRVGRAKFHDCEYCNSTIPSMLEHCPYCGSEQDIGAHYTRRERKFKPLPAEIEDEPVDAGVDENEIVRGYEGYDKHASELGFNEEQLEGEWDENLTEAEKYFDSKDEERLAADVTASETGEVEDTVTSTKLGEVMDELPQHDLDAFLGDVESRRHLADADVELTASDANYREQIFELTGEDGVLPGQEVNVDAMVDNTVVGNEVRSASSDFTIQDGGEPVTNSEPESEPTTEEPAPKRRGIRRRKKDE